ncbi:PorP/SprF family type IX secretion system membrane protein [Mucilaginibacter antarcticus]|uniref:Type IX secretion system membrane protein PorP/SprF n=2 Tax=Mucilaginibacter antarcticus TaxID=1855725 RepID=A0ABW5XNF0_9SPHI
MRRRLIKCILFISVFGVNASYAQHTIHLSQYLFNGLVVNPAYAGYRDNWTINASSRLQWEGVKGAPKTNTLSVDGALGEDGNVGLGVLVSNERLGPEINTAGYINYAYRIKLSDDDSHRLSFGVAAGAVQYAIDASLFNAGAAIDPTVTTGVQTKLAPDFRVGIYYYSPLFYVGASALNLIPNAYPDPNSIFVRETRTYYLTTGFIVPISPVVNWRPSMLVKEDFKGPTNINLSTYFLLADMVWVGASYNSGVVLWNKSNLQTNLNTVGAVTGAVAVNITPLCRFGYSYDFATSKLSGFQGASHEISLSLGFSRRKDRVLSPRFF